MAITKQITAYEFLVRWNNGVLAGAHIRMLETISENGVVLSQKEGAAQPVSLAGELGFPIADVLSALQVTALTDLTTAQAAKAASDAALKTTQDALAVAEAKAVTLQAQIDAYTQATSNDPEGPTVDDLQIRLALNELGWRDAVEAAVAQSSQDIKDWWAKARNIKRRNWMVRAIGEALGKTDAELDGLWALAATK
ncbi:MAG: hypothetical protein FD135_2357 [Comamonadaceae bacterium]|nr:MAG: hypothetical protein FD135_2357 [Comamonadaceae bacterium]